MAASPAQKRESAGLRLSTGDIQPIYAWKIATMMASSANENHARIATAASAITACLAPLSYDGGCHWILT